MGLAPNSRPGSTCHGFGKRRTKIAGATSTAFLYLSGYFVYPRSEAL